MSFLKYPHVERMYHPHIAGMEVGLCHIFPKLDGTNASVWAADVDGICMGSRKRELSEGADNAGFLAYVTHHDPLIEFIAEHGDTLRLYGEWLVPHTFKGYRDDAWRKFYIFDVFNHETASLMPYDLYAPLLEPFGLDVIPPMATIKDPAEKDLLRLLESNTYLCRDGEGPGEGIVIKNYEWLSQLGSQPWGKLVRNEFKEDAKKNTMFRHQDENGSFQVESAIAVEFCTKALVDKELAKIQDEISPPVPNDKNQWPEWEKRCRAALELERPKIIPRLLQTCYHCVVVEDLWAALKKHKDPTINFKKLRAFVVAEVKRHAANLF